MTFHNHIHTKPLPFYFYLSFHLPFRNIKNTLTKPKPSVILFFNTKSDTDHIKINSITIILLNDPGKGSYQKFLVEQ